MSSKMLVDSLEPTASECQEQSIKNVARKTGVAYKQSFKMRHIESIICMM